ncbi:PorP/SprF family type IX secretion system membrane protein [Pontibacter liquoris]|uniref:PorP/SprF family type IX secretion system membrane protein n=1 Tax=Pontibacter liquoris TaxID=2905677 RepID=UPI001FA7930C|nr:type IX secretion system membrane protein PorP/SprF [Pontibacter liquoris]
MKKKATLIRWFLLLPAVLLAQTAAAQQAPQYSQYIFNELAINPAYAGSKEILNINATYRSQWTGLEGAPVTQTISVDGLTANPNLGWGAHIVNDALGAQRQTGVYADVAVRLATDHYSKLALGISAGAAQYVLDGTMLQTGSGQPDAAVPEGKEVKILPDAKIGVFFNTQRFYAGLTAASLVPYKSDKLLVATPRRHYFISTGYLLDLGPSLRLKPSILLKEDFKSPTNIDLNTFLLLNNRFWVGASYRTAMPLFTNLEMKQLGKRNAVAVMAQLYATPRLRVGYSYDISLSKLNNYASHEISLGYSFYKKSHGRIMTPRNL